MLFPRQPRLEPVAGHLLASRNGGAATVCRAVPGTPADTQEVEFAARFSAAERWIVLCEAASADFRASRCDLHSTEEYQLRGEPCQVHGDGCLRLICGIMLQHVRWRFTEPARAAAELLAIFLPAPPPTGVQGVGSPRAALMSEPAVLPNHTGSTARTGRENRSQAGRFQGLSKTRCPSH